MKLFYSSETTGNIDTQLGTQHYSYRFVADKFLKLFDTLDIDCTRLAHPEAVKHSIALRHLNPDNDDMVHVAFRSSENFRLVPGVANVCHFAWEFPVLSNIQLAHEAITSNQVRMLGLADEIWTPSHYACKVLADHGLTNCVYMPTPIAVEDENGRPLRLSRADALAELEHVMAMPLQMSSGLGIDLMRRVSYHSLGLLIEKAGLDHPERDGKVFLLICNPGDLRKNLLNAIDGFQLGAGPEDVLIVKLLVPNRGDFVLSAEFDHLSPRLRGPACVQSAQVIFVFEYVSDTAMSALYSIADFYLSAPHMEGYNLPLIEAMAHGCIPVSNANTAMADYIDTTDAVVMDEAIYPGLIRNMAGDVGGRVYEVPISDRFQIGRAVRTAHALSPDARATLADAARQQVVRLYSEQVVARMVVPRLEALARKHATQEQVV